jgi:large conductance mechanosensitive channel
MDTKKIFTTTTITYKEVGSKFKGSVNSRFQGFLTFLGQNAILTLALGVIIGSATKDVVNQLVSGIITPFITIFISLFSKNVDFKSLNTTINGVPVYFGDFLNSLLSMVIIMLILYITFGIIFKRNESLGIKEETKEVKSTPKKR